MTLENLGNVGEFVGALAVVISLVYLAVQIRQNTRAVRSASHQTLVSSEQAIQASISDNPEVARIVVQANKDFDVLNEEDRMRFVMLAARFFSNFENVFYQYSRGLIDEDLWRPWLEGMRFFVHQPGVQRYWETFKFGFAEPFRELIDKQLQAERD
jgi:hypothetical protein